MSDSDEYLRETIRRIHEQQRLVEEARRQSRFIEEARQHSRLVEEALRQSRLLEEAQRQSRLVEEAHRHSRRLDLMHRIIDEERRLYGGISAHEFAANVERLRRYAFEQKLAAGSAIQRAFDQYHLLIERAASPLPTLLLDTIRQQDELARRYDRLRGALRDASVWADVALPDDEDASDEDVAAAVESQLIEVVPAEALAELRRGSFLSFSLLAKAMARPEAIRDLSPRGFEEFIAELASRLGLEDVQLTRATADGGRDVVGTFTMGGSRLIVALECKRYRRDRAVGVAFARALLGTIHHPETAADHGILVTTSRFSSPARHFIVTAPRIDGVEFDGIVDWLRRAESGQRLELRGATT